MVMTTRRRFLERSLLTVCGCLGLAAAARGAPQERAGDDIAGVWLTEAGDSKVEIRGNGGVWGGKVVWLATPEREGAPIQDVRNVDTSLRGRPIMGLEVLEGFARNGEGTWGGGTIYSPRQGKSFPAGIRLSGTNRLEITVNAGLISKTVVWTR
jgi:uncharacterized protein (DUF2147 family)